MSSSRVSCCIVTSEIAGPHLNGGVGTHCLYLARHLAARPDTTSKVVYYGRIERHDEDYWIEHFREKFGITFEWIDPSEDTGRRFRKLSATQFDRGSIRVAEHLAADESDVYFFQELLGLGYRTFQMKRHGLAFQRSLLTCMVHSSLDWIGEAMNCLPQNGAVEALTKQLERSSVASCEWLLSPSRYMMNWAQRDQKFTHPHTAVLPYLFELPGEPMEKHSKPRKLIFFGRLEERKGLVLFLEALRHLAGQGVAKDAPLEVVFLGKIGQTRHGTAEESFQAYADLEAAGITFKPLTDRSHHEAVELLRSNEDAVVVCPSLVDNMPYAIIEAVSLNCNVIVARTGGIPELFADEGRVFEPTVESLAAKLTTALNGELPSLNPAYSPEMARELWDAWLAKILTCDWRTDAAPVRTAVPTAAIVSSTHPHLQEVLAVAAEQKVPVFAAAGAGLAGPATAGGDLAQLPAVTIESLPDRVVAVPNVVVPLPAAFDELPAAARFSGTDILHGLSLLHPIEENDEDSSPIVIGTADLVGELLPYGNVFGWGCLCLSKRAATALLATPKVLEGSIEVARFLWQTKVDGMTADGVPVVADEIIDGAPNARLSLYDRSVVDRIAAPFAATQEIAFERMARATAGATVLTREIHKLRWLQEQVDVQRLAKEAAYADCEEKQRRLVAARSTLSQRESLSYLIPQVFRRAMAQIISTVRRS